MNSRNFKVHVVGEISSNEVESVKDKLHSVLEETECGLSVVELDHHNEDISLVYQRALDGNMLIVYGMPWNFPSFGSLSRSLFGPHRDAEGVLEYVKKINIVATNKNEKMAWENYLVFLHQLITWSSTQVDDFLPAKEFLKNVFIVSSIDEIVIPNKDEAQKSLHPVPPEDNVVMELDAGLQEELNRDFIGLQTQVIYGDQPVYGENITAAVISCATPLLPYSASDYRLFDEVGRSLANQGITHLYGAAVNPGVMRALAEPSWKAGGTVMGVISAREYIYYEKPRPTTEMPWAMLNLEKIYITPHLAARTRRLLSADFLIIGPGGTGTIDEWTLFQTDPKHKDKPVFLINANGHLDHLEAFILNLLQQGLLKNPVHFIKSPSDVTDVFIPAIESIKECLLKRDSSEKSSQGYHFRQFKPANHQQKATVDEEKDDACLFGARP